MIVTLIFYFCFIFVSFRFLNITKLDHQKNMNMIIHCILYFSLESLSFFFLLLFSFIVRRFENETQRKYYNKKNIYIRMCMCIYIFWWLRNIYYMCIFMYMYETFSVAFKSGFVHIAIYILAAQTPTWILHFRNIVYINIYHSYIIIYAMQQWRWQQRRMKLIRFSSIRNFLFLSMHCLFFFH